MAYAFLISLSVFPSLFPLYFFNFDKKNSLCFFLFHQRNSLYFFIFSYNSQSKKWIFSNFPRLPKWCLVQREYVPKLSWAFCQNSACKFLISLYQWMHLRPRKMIDFLIGTLPVFHVKIHCDISISISKIQCTFSVFIIRIHCTFSFSHITRKARNKFFSIFPRLPKWCLVQIE